MKTVRQIYFEHLKVLSEMTGLSFDTLRCSRMKGAPLYRGFVFKALREMGYSLASISEASGRNHATIIHMTKQAVRFAPKEVQAIHEKYLQFIKDTEK